MATYTVVEKLNLPRAAYFVDAKTGDISLARTKERVANSARTVPGNFYFIRDGDLVVKCLDSDVPSKYCLSTSEKIQKLQDELEYRENFFPDDE